MTKKLVDDRSSDLFYLLCVKFFKITDTNISQPRIRDEKLVDDHSSEFLSTKIYGREVGTNPADRPKAVA